MVTSSGCSAPPIQSATEVLPPVLGVPAFSDGDSRIYYRGDGITQSQLAPGILMTTLNYQLFRSTPEDKYVTMHRGALNRNAWKARLER
jgi:hypothetical protein